MNKRDQLKVTAAGFRIVRADDTPNFRIKYIDKDTPEWRTLERNFSSAASRNARLSQLLDEPLTVQD